MILLNTEKTTKHIKGEAKTTYQIDTGLRNALFISLGMLMHKKGYQAIPAPDEEDKTGFMKALKRVRKKKDYLLLPPGVDLQIDGTVERFGDIRFSFTLSQSTNRIYIEVEKENEYIFEDVRFHSFLDEIELMACRIISRVAERGGLFSSTITKRFAREVAGVSGWPIRK